MDSMFSPPTAAGVHLLTMERQQNEMLGEWILWFDT
jgi:hypothetical protein